MSGYRVVALVLLLVLMVASGGAVSASPMLMSKCTTTRRVQVYDELQRTRFATYKFDIGPLSDPISAYRVRTIANDFYINICAPNGHSCSTDDTRQYLAHRVSNNAKDDDQDKCSALSQEIDARFDSLHPDVNLVPLDEDDLEKGVKLVYSNGATRLVDNKPFEQRLELLVRCNRGDTHSAGGHGSIEFEQEVVDRVFRTITYQFSTSSTHGCPSELATDPLLEFLVALVIFGPCICVCICCCVVVVSVLLCIALCIRCLTSMESTPSGKYAPLYNDNNNNNNIGVTTAAQYAYNGYNPQLPQMQQMQQQYGATTMVQQTQHYSSPQQRQDIIQQQQPQQYYHTPQLQPRQPQQPQQEV